ncbi:alpha/beta hydrolase family protein [Mycobacteroides abscessus]|uniref:alpha/beta hydrolase family protein n=1 Tax=Mycobacteroides abscessus TaxID=36809 RepID=UPI000928662C|nr:prolyl oligopeptidase family serine peptidase [Mycobacteroides abscessus]SHT50988.1 prolyl oligopeptidase family protein [Mycobacteroides abscessus subsp. abscessus]SKJ76843.1 prolyl oligopeptidase family protein [Mycobacteroides abscessus subsp. abscessus]
MTAELSEHIEQPRITPRPAPTARPQLPRPGDLTLRERAMVETSALTDIALRTVGALSVMGVVAPSLVIDREFVARERHNLAFYGELAAMGDADLSFPEPEITPVVFSRPAGPVAKALAKATVENLDFESPYQTRNPALRDYWKRFPHNSVARAQHWRHDDGPRPTLCVIHGFFGSPYLLNGAFFALPWFFRNGYDVLLYTLPFHGRRAEKYSPFSGAGYFSHGFTGFSESMCQAVHDFRIFVNYLRGTGVEKIGLTGLSLGGYTTGLISTVERRIDVTIPNVPVVDVKSLLHSWIPAEPTIKLAARLGHLDQGRLDGALSYSSPLTYQPVVPREQRLIITGLGDRLAPPEQSEMLWEHWDRCALHWFPGNHILHVNQGDYLRRMTEFLDRHLNV